MRQFACGAKKDEILEGEAVAVAGSPLGGEKPGPCLGAYLWLGQTQ